MLDVASLCEEDKRYASHVEVMARVVKSSHKQDAFVNQMSLTIWHEGPGIGIMDRSLEVESRAHTSCLLQVFLQPLQNFNGFSALKLVYKV